MPDFYRYEDHPSEKPADNAEAKSDGKKEK